MIEKIIAGAIGAVFAAVILSVMTKFTNKVNVLFEPAIPDGAIVALLKPCAEFDGWEDYTEGAGKFLLGAGKGTLRPQGPHMPPLDSGQSEISLSEIEFGDQGGEEKHKLIISEMPSHSHPVSTYEWGHSVDGDGSHRRIDVNDGFPYERITGRLDTEEMGSNAPHNNMPPYIAVYFCKKS